LDTLHGMLCRATHRVAGLAVTAILLGAASAPAAVMVPPGFDQRILVQGLTQPTQAAWAPDGRMFVAEKPGRIRVVSTDGTLRTAPLLDITGRVNDVQDRGLLGIAVDPQFASTGRLYYAFTYELNPAAPDSDAPMVARIERITVNPDNSISTPTVVLGQDVSGPCPRVADDCLASNGRSHSIGTIRFGADGTLWAGLGDSASYSEVDDLAFRAQEEGTLSGKILHIDTSGHGLAGHPFCPSVTDLTKACTKLHAKGFRNPYRFTLRGGIPMVGDVGWGDREELDRVAAGGNYGWPCHEGDRQTVGYSSDPRCLSLYGAGGVTAPLWTYSHANANAAIVGGPAMPADGGAYGSDYANNQFVGDYAKGLVQRLDLHPDGTCVTNPCTVLPFASGWAGGTDLELSPRATLVWTLFGTGGPDGSIVELVRAGANRSPVATATVAPLAGTGDRGYRLSSASSTDPDGDPLTSSWDFGDGTTGSGTTVDHTYAASVQHATVRLTVTDGRGAGATSTIALTPGNRPPAPSITAPANGALFTDGQPVTLSGTATDAEDGTLSGAALSWRVILRHGNHVHVLTERSGATTAFTPFDDHDADSGYEITLVATDSAGNRVETPMVALRPRTVKLTLLSNPPGATLGYADQALTAPVTRDAAVGFRTTLTAPASFTWSDGAPAQRPLVIPPTNLTLTATSGTGPGAGPGAGAGGTPAGSPKGGGPAGTGALRCIRLRKLVVTLAPKGTRRLRVVRVRAGSHPVPYRVLDRRRVRVDLRELPRSSQTIRLHGRATNRRGRTRTVAAVRRVRFCARVRQ
jgi:glucose/arabinose dehydrogenase